MDDLFAPRRKTMRDHIDAMAPVSRLATYVAIAAGCIATLSIGSWYMRGLAVPALVVIAVAYKLVVPGKATTRHGILLFRIWAIALAFFSIGAFTPPIVRWVGTVIATVAWFLLSPLQQRVRGPGSL